MSITFIRRKLPLSTFKNTFHKIAKDFLINNVNEIWIRNKSNAARPLYAIAKNLRT